MAMSVSENMDGFVSARSLIGDVIMKLAEEKDDIWMVTPDIGFSTGDFKKKYPHRFIDTGIAEQCCIGVSAGLALEGKVVYVIGMMPFMSLRDLDQVRNDLCYGNLKVRIIGNCGGLTTNGGSTHYAMEDIAVLSSLVNMTVISISDPGQLRSVMMQSYDYDGPIAIRMDPGKQNEILYTQDTEFKIGKGYVVSDGGDITIFAHGEIVGEAIKAIEELKGDGINVKLIDMFTIKPLDKQLVISAAEQTGQVIVWEDHLTKNGLASAVSDCLVDHCVPLKSFKRFGIPQVYPGFGVASEQYQKYRYNADAVIKYTKGLQWGGKDTSVT